ncbi:MAG: GGDEF domain-containing protein [Patescibacteria group bacterium]|nr:GGDEF domain-containing protein [Patescibacteria group bacterium]MCL5432331.1 GGDEF domain-containing protein [Patescibacteria group bacterium]
MPDSERRSPREIELQAEIEQLKHQLELDYLTGAANSRAFDKEIKGLGKLAHSGMLQNIGFIYADIDDFKKINDQLSHAFGDEALKIVAATLQGSGRSKLDTAFRFSGDEFGLLLPNADELVVQRIMQKINASLKKPVRHEDNEGVVTITMGIAIFPETSIDKLKKVAEKAMRDEKKNKGVGR